MPHDIDLLYRWYLVVPALAAIGAAFWTTGRVMEAIDRISRAKGGTGENSPVFFVFMALAYGGMLWLPAKLVSWWIDGLPRFLRIAGFYILYGVLAGAWLLALALFLRLGGRTVADRLMPKWRHSDPTVRRAAIATIGRQETLVRISRTDSDSECRRTAIGFLDEEHLKNTVADDGLELSLRSFALARVQDQVFLAKVATGDPHDELLRAEAIARVADARVLAAIARHDQSLYLRKAALKNVRDVDVLRDINRSVALCETCRGAGKWTDTHESDPSKVDGFVMTYTTDESCARCEGRGLVEFPFAATGPSA